MDTFTFSGQTVAFLGILALLEALIVLLFPLLAIVSAVIALVLIVFVWLKTGIRTGKWFWWNPANVPLTQAEGAIAASAALLFAVGLLVGGYEGIRHAAGERTLLMGYAFRHMRDGMRDTPDTWRAGARGTHYSDSDMQRSLKEELTKAGIPFSLETRDGNEFVVWTPEHNAAVEVIVARLHRGPSATGRSVHFDKPDTQQAFKEWLVKRGIAYETTTMRGKEFVIWKEGPRELAMEFLKEHYRPCPEEAAGRDAGKAGQARC